MKRITKTSMHFNLVCILQLLVILYPIALFSQWQTVYNGGKYYIMGIHFKDENTGFAGGFNMASDSVVILRTLNGGNYWEEICKIPGWFCGPYDFDFVNDTLGFGGGQDGVVYRTIDGGSNWELFSNIGGLNDIYNIQFFNSNIGMASGMRTTDGGYTWSSMNINKTHDFHVINDSSCFTTTFGGIFYTSDFGANWLKVDPDTNEFYTSVCLATDLVGYASKDPDKIYKTVDGGMNWFLYDSIPDLEINQIRFTSENNGYVLGNFYGSMRVMKTTDGGQSWSYSLFGNDRSYAMALINENTVLVPTINGQMFKTTNGGGSGFVPHYSEADWISKLSASTGKIINVEDVALDSNSNLYISGSFQDTLIVNQSVKINSDYPGNYSAYILKFKPWGSLDWYKVIEEPDSNYFLQDLEVDVNNNLLSTATGGNYSSTQIRKHSGDGNLLWTKNLTTTGESFKFSLNTNGNNEIILSGSFSGWLFFENDSIHTSNFGVFILKLDSEGNLLNLVKVAEISPVCSNSVCDMNDEGEICLSLFGFGNALINNDTIDFAGSLLLYLDSSYNLKWYNNEINEPLEGIAEITFKSNSSVIVNGKDHVNDTIYSFIYEYDDQGNKISHNLIRYGEFSGFNTLTVADNERIITCGYYKDYTILENDTLYGFELFNTYLYTLATDLSLIKSSQIGGVLHAQSIIEENGNSFIVGRISGMNILFSNDTLITNANDRIIIAKLNSIITPVNETVSYDQTFLVYPNPTQGKLYMRYPFGLSGNCLVQLYNSQGQKVLETSVSEKNQCIDLRSLQSGIYFVQTQLGQEISTQKIIKK
jgi:photosystem II stability/assembly factor-like uncharacterized protein